MVSGLTPPDKNVDFKELDSKVNDIRDTVRFNAPTTNASDSLGIGFGSGSVETPTVNGLLSLPPITHNTGVVLEWTGATGTLNGNDTVDTTATAWQGTLATAFVGTDEDGTAFFELVNATVFTDVAQTLNVGATWTGATYTTGSFKLNSLFVRSSSILVDDINGDPTVGYLAQVKPLDGQILLIKPINGKTLTLTTGGNIDISSATTIEDNSFALLQFHRDNINADSEGSYSVLSGGGGGSSSNTIKQQVRATTTGVNNVLHPIWGDTFDGVTVVEGDRILIKDQTTQADNGIYVVGAVVATVFTATRATDFDNDSEVVASTLVAVEEGTLYANKIFMLITNNPITVGVTALVFSPDSFGDDLGNHMATQQLDMQNWDIVSTVAPTGGNQFRLVFDSHDDSDTYISNSTTSDRISIISNGTAILELLDTEILVESTTPINLNTSNINTIGYLDFGTGSPSGGTIRLPNTSGIIRWESTPSGSEGELYFDVDEQFIWTVPSGGAFTFWEGGFQVAEINTSGIDLQLNSLTNARNVQVASNTSTAGFRDIGFTADPTSPLAGELYYNTTSNVYKFYSGSAWVNVGMSFIGFTADADLDMNGFDVDNTTEYKFKVTSGTQPKISASSDSLNMNFFVNGTQIVTFNDDGTVPADGNIIVKGGTFGGVLKTLSTEASPSSGATIGQISFDGFDSGVTSPETFALIKAKTKVVTAGSEEGSIVFEVRDGGGGSTTVPSFIMDPTTFRPSGTRDIGSTSSTWQGGYFDNIYSQFFIGERADDSAQLSLYHNATVVGAGDILGVINFNGDITGTDNFIEGLISVTNKSVGALTAESVMDFSVLNGTGSAVTYLQLDGENDKIDASVTLALNNNSITDVSSLAINNPADTFSYILTGAAITANRAIDLPLLTSPDQFTFNLATQSLANKTIDASLNTITKIGAAESEPDLISGQPLIATVDSTNDRLLIWDATDSLLKEVAPDDLGVGGATHELLSATHTDTTTATVSRGSIIVGQTATPKWQELTIGGANNLLGSDGTDLAYTQVTNSFVSASAAIDFSKLATLTSGNILVGSVGNVATSVNPTGDIDVSNTGVFSINAGVIVDADINASAAIAVSKISGTAVSLSGAQTITGNKTFKDDTLKIEAPTSGFDYIFSSNDIVANRTISLPLLTGNDTFTFISASQTLINKGIDADNNTIINIGDSEVVAHTTTKITTTNKSLLNSNIVYNDQSNVFGDFSQVFADDKLTIDNPAGTFSYNFQASAIVADRTITIPLLTGNDTMVTVAHAQSLTNKTIDGDLNTFVDINETQQNVSVGVAGTILTSNGVGSPPTYQTTAGVSLPIEPAITDNGAGWTGTQTLNLATGDGHVFKWTVDQNLTFAAGVLNEPSSGTQRTYELEFEHDEVGGTFTVTLPSDFVDDDGVTLASFTISTGTVILSCRINDGTIHRVLQKNVAASGVTSAHVLLDSTVHTDTTTGTVATGDIMTGQSSKWARLVKGTANQVLSMDGTGTDIVWTAAAGGSQTPWTSDIDADGFDLKDLSNIELRTTTLAPAVGTQAIWADAGGININVPTNDILDILVQGSSTVSFGAAATIISSGTTSINSGTINIGADPGDFINFLAKAQTDLDMNDSDLKNIGALTTWQDGHSVVTTTTEYKTKLSGVSDTFKFENSDASASGIWDRDGMDFITTQSTIGYTYQAITAGATADTTVIYSESYFGRNSTPSNFEFARMEVRVDDNTVSNEDAAFIWTVADTSGLDSYMRWTGNTLELERDGAVPVLVFNREEVSDSAGEIGSIDWKTQDSAGLETFASLDVDATNTLNGSEEGKFELRVKSNGTFVTPLLFDGDTASGALTIFDNSSGKIGFYGTTPAARPTSVAVTAAGIHAALVTLGLIT